MQTAITDARRVGLLKLTTATRAEVGRATQCVIDALRAVELPTDGLPGRLIVRSLDLGVLPAHASPDVAARQVAEAIERACANALVFTSPMAATAPAILAPVGLDLWIELARLACRPAPFDPHAWFWPLLAPGLVPERGQLLARSLDALAREAFSMPAASRLLALLVEEGAAEPLLKALTPARAQQLLQAWPPSAAAAPPARMAALRDARPAAPPPPPLAPRWQRLLHAWVPSWGESDARSRWLCASALWCVQPARAWAELDTSQQVRELARASLLRASHPSAQPARAAAPAQPRAAAAADHVSDAGGASTGREVAGVGERAASAEPAARSSARYGLDAAAATEFGGLLFLLPVLRRLGIDAFLAESAALADTDLLRRVLVRVLDGLQAPADDAMRAALGETDQAVLVSEFAVPAAWLHELTDVRSLQLQQLPGREQAILHVTPDGWPVALRCAGSQATTSIADVSAIVTCVTTGLDALVQAWQCAVAAWLARFTELDTRALVCRRGLLALTPTHIDVSFDLKLADVRVRRSALDLNPGYVRELGRVVTFHYRRYDPRLG